jgi:hypothetical protein
MLVVYGETRFELLILSNSIKICEKLSFENLCTSSDHFE